MVAVRWEPLECMPAGSVVALRRPLADNQKLRLRWGRLPSMLEVLSLLMDFALKIVPGLSKHRQAKRLNQIGADLFQVYILINESIMLGEIIMERLESGLQALARRIASDGDMASVPATGGLDLLVVRQLQNLTLIAGLLGRYSAELQVVDGAAYAQLSKLLESKLSMLNLLGKCNCI